MKFLKHSKDTVGDYQSRVLLHIPVGFLMGLMPFSGTFKDLFFYYEESEDKWVKDEAWKDYAGSMIGFVLGRLTLFVVVVYLIVRLMGWLEKVI